MRATAGLLLVIFWAPAAYANDEPAGPATALSLDAGCAVETSLDAPEDFYPPGSRRRSEAGEVLIEFTAATGEDRARDVVLVKGSGFEDLDRAALNLAVALKVSTACGALRVRRSIVFEVWREPGAKPEVHGCLVYDVAIFTVSIFSVDGA